MVKASVKVRALLPLMLFTFASAEAAKVEHPVDSEPARLTYSIIARWPHSTARFTQGLVIHKGEIYESTGGYGSSGLYQSELRGDELRRSHRLDHRYFGEGLALHSGLLVQLTWREGVAFLYDLALRPRGLRRIEGQGWGLASDGRHLIQSDGSATLRVLDPATLHPVRQLVVRDRGRPVPRLNELEYARGLIWANVWMTDRIAAIDPDDGRVLGWLNLADLKTTMRKPPGWKPREHVLNGIAFDDASGHFFVTGKCWPLLFEIAVSPLPEAGRSIPAEAPPP